MVRSSLGFGYSSNVAQVSEEEPAREAEPPVADEEATGVTPAVSSLSTDHPIWNYQILAGSGSLPEVFASVKVPSGDDVHWTKTMMSFIGPGSLIAVGYMDPGNWSTDIAGGSAFGYRLLFIVLMSSVIAMFLQHLTIKLAYATGRDLAQACRDSYKSKPLIYVLWIVAEAAIIATDLAEVIGSAIAMKLLFGLPIIAGVCITAVDALVILFLQNKRFHWIERLILLLVATVTISFLVQLIMSKPDSKELLTGYLPSAEIFQQRDMLYVAIGIVGATVMPHNLFLHSSIVLTRSYSKEERNVRDAIKYSTWDSCVHLVVALFVNSSILILAASVFHVKGYTEVATLEEAYVLLNPLLGGEVSSKLFGIALLASGQSSTITGTLAGQIVMEGFLNWKIHPVFRRVITRVLAIIPAIVTVVIMGDRAINELLILSQVVLSYALPFAVFPLVHITADSKRMGIYVNQYWVTALACAIAGLLVSLNIILLSQQSSE